MATCTNSHVISGDKIGLLLECVSSLLSSEFVKLHYKLHFSFERLKQRICDKECVSNGDKLCHFRRTLRQLQHTVNGICGEDWDDHISNSGEKHEQNGICTAVHERETATSNISEVGGAGEDATAAVDDDDDDLDPCPPSSSSSNKGLHLRSSSISDSSVKNATVRRNRVKRAVCVDRHNSSVAKRHDLIDYSCPLCATIAKRPVELAAHITNHHSEYWCDDSDGGGGDDSGGLYVCRLCHTCSVSGVQLRQHHQCQYGTKDHSSVIQRLISSGVLIVTLVKKSDDQQQQRRLRLICWQCCGEFRSSSMFLVHSRFCTPPPYSCHLCELSFATQPLLVTHKLQQHSPANNNLFVCPAVGCCLSFRRFPAFQKHLVQRHLDEESGSASQTSTESPFVCKLCGKMFVKKIYLTHHRMRYHHDNLDRKFICEVCGAQLGTVSALNTHVSAVHGDRKFACSLCARSFSRKDRLLRHMRLHSGVKPHQCGVCGKAFAQRCKLNEHLRRHRGEKRFRCPVCSNQYAANSDLKSHLRRIHNMDLVNKTHTIQSLSNCLRPINSSECDKTSTGGGSDVMARAAVSTLATPTINRTNAIDNATVTNSTPDSILTPPTVGGGCVPSISSVCVQTSSNQHPQYVPLATAAAGLVILTPQSNSSTPLFAVL